MHIRHQQTNKMYVRHQQTSQMYVRHQPVKCVLWKETRLWVAQKRYIFANAMWLNKACNLVGNIERCFIVVIMHYCVHYNCTCQCELNGFQKGNQAKKLKNFPSKPTPWRVLKDAVKGRPVWVEQRQDNKDNRELTSLLEQYFQFCQTRIGCWPMRISI